MSEPLSLSPYSRPMFFAAIASAVIILLCFNRVVSPFLLLGLMGLILAWLLFRRKIKLRFILPFVLIALMLLSVVKREKEYSNSVRYEGVEAEAQLTVVDGAEVSDSGTVYLVARIDSCSFLPKGAKLNVKADSVGIKMGDVVTANIFISEIYNRKTDIYYFSNGILGSIKATDIEIKDNNIYYSSVRRLREAITRSIQANVSEPQSYILSALLIGDKSDFSSEFSMAVRNSGLSHIMVVSGMHFAVIMGAFFKFIKSIGVGRKLQLVLSLGFIFLFMSLCGFSASVIRAALNYILVSIAIFRGKDRDALNILSTAVCVMLAADPYVLFSISFQLSVLATLGILVLLPIMEKSFQRVFHSNKYVTAVFSVFAASTAAMIATLPVIIWNFKDVSLLSPISNIAVSPVINLVMPITAVAVLIDLILPLEFLVRPAFFAAGMMAKYINAIIMLFGSKFKLIVEFSDAVVIFTTLLILFLPSIRRAIAKAQYKAELRRRYNGDNF